MNPARHLYSLEEIKTRLLPRAGELARRLAPDGHLAGAEWMARNPSRMDRKAGSFCVNIRKGVWKDFATDQGGDMLALIAEFACAGDYKRAVPWALDFLGLTGKAPDPVETARIAAEAKKARDKQDEDAAARRGWAFKLFCDARPLDGSDPASLYLRARGVDVTKFPNGIPRCLRFHPKVRAFPEGTDHPGMIACLSKEGLKNGFAAVHRTYLACAGGVWGKMQFANVDGKRMSAKRILGSWAGASIRLTPGASGKKLKDAPAREWIIAGEGIENTLTGAIARPELRSIAAGSVSNLGNLVLPDAIGGVFVLKDNDLDEKAIAAFDRALEKLRERHAVALVDFGADFKDANDALMGKKRPRDERAMARKMEMDRA